MRVVLPAPLTPIRQVSTPGRKAPLMPSSSSSMACPPSWFTCSLPTAASCMLVAGRDCATSILLAAYAERSQSLMLYSNTPAMLEACYSRMATNAGRALLVGMLVTCCSLLSRHKAVVGKDYATKQAPALLHLFAILSRRSKCASADIDCNFMLYAYD